MNTVAAALILITAIVWVVCLIEAAIYWIRRFKEPYPGSTAPYTPDPQEFK